MIGELERETVAMLRVGQELSGELVSVEANGLVTSRVVSGVVAVPHDPWMWYSSGVCESVILQ